MFIALFTTAGHLPLIWDTAIQHTRFHPISQTHTL